MKNHHSRAFPSPKCLTWPWSESPGVRANSRSPTSRGGQTGRVRNGPGARRERKSFHCGIVGARRQPMKATTVRVPVETTHIGGASGQPWAGHGEDTEWVRRAVREFFRPSRRALV